MAGVTLVSVSSEAEAAVLVQSILRDYIEPENLRQAMCAESSRRSEPVPSVKETYRNLRRAVCPLLTRSCIGTRCLLVV